MRPRWITGRAVAAATAAACMAWMNGQTEARAETPAPPRALSLAPVAADVAPSPIERPAMRAALHTYFRGEANEASLFALAGMGAGVASSLLFQHGTDFTRGFAWPLVAVGLIQLGAGIVLHARTPAQVAGLDTMLMTTPADLKAIETTRMKRVVIQFTVLEILETSLIAGGAAAAIVGGVLDEDLVLGVGVGLAIQAAFMLTLDYFAHRRANRYLDALKRFDAGTAAAGAP